MMQAFRALWVTLIAVTVTLVLPDAPRAAAGSVNIYDWDVVVADTFNAGGTHVHGSLALGGNLVGSGQVQLGMDKTSDEYSALIGGNVTNGQLTVLNGKVQVKGTVAGTPVIEAGASLESGSIGSSLPGFVGFMPNQIQDALNAASSFYTSFSAPTGGFDASDWNQAKFTLTPTPSSTIDLAVVSLHASDLQKAATLLSSNLDLADQWVINVTGNYDSSMNFGGGWSGKHSQILWNFTDATSIRLKGGEWFGTILAPSATLIVEVPQVTGHLFVQNLTVNNSRQLHPSKFTPPVVPTPSAAVAGLAMLAGLAVRRRVRS